MRHTRAPPPKRIENGQLGIVESVDPERDTFTLLPREPGAEPRLSEIDQARLHGEHAVGQRAAAVRLNYAMHSFPAQGATNLVRAIAVARHAGSRALKDTPVLCRSPSFSGRYSAVSAQGAPCPIEAVILGRLEDHECRHGRLPGDRTTPCGCWPQEPSHARPPGQTRAPAARKGDLSPTPRVVISG